MRREFLMLAAALLASTPALAQGQLSDRSGAITFSVGVAPFVEVVSHEPSFHDLTSNRPEGARPGVGTIRTGDLFRTNPVIREVRANTPYRLSVVGPRPDGKIVFTSAQGDEIALTAMCDHLEVADPSTRSLATLFNCLGSSVFPPASSRWVLFHAYTALAIDTQHARAGTYTATVYVQIDAA